MYMKHTSNSHHFAGLLLPVNRHDRANGSRTFHGWITNAHFDHTNSDLFGLFGLFAVLLRVAGSIGGFANLWTLDF